jgi:hypothetical protein
MIHRLGPADQMDKDALIRFGESFAKVCGITVKK